MTKNQEIIEALRYFYLIGAADGVAKSISPKCETNFLKRLDEFWNNGGKNLFPNIELRIEMEEKKC